MEKAPIIHADGCATQICPSKNLGVIGATCTCGCGFQRDADYLYYLKAEAQFLGQILKMPFFEFCMQVKERRKSLLKTQRGGRNIK